MAPVGASTWPINRVGPALSCPQVVSHSSSARMVNALMVTGARGKRVTYCRSAGVQACPPRQQVIVAWTAPSDPPPVMMGHLQIDFGVVAVSLPCWPQVGLSPDCQLRSGRKSIREKRVGRLGQGPRPPRARLLATQPRLVCPRADPGALGTFWAIAVGLYLLLV